MNAHNCFAYLRMALAVAVCYCMLIASERRALAVLITDNFDTSHDYSGKVVTGTIWDGVLFNDGTAGTQNASVSVANANTTNAGRLTVASSNGNWENADDDGFLLYRNVSGDFTAIVEVSAATTIDFHDLGLMARVGNVSDAGPGEDWIAGRYFAAVSFTGTRFRSTNNGVSSDSTLAGSLRSFLKLERSANLFTFTAANDNAFTSGVVSTNVTRSDLAGLPVQVGIWQATFIANTGTAQFDNFSLQFVPEPGSFALLAMGAVGLRFARRRNRS